MNALLASKEAVFLMNKIGADTDGLNCSHPQGCRSPASVSAPLLGGVK